MMRRALVTGGTGKIGTLLIKELLQQKFSVKLLLRKKEGYPNNQKSISELFPSNVEIFWGNITDYNDVLAAVSGADYVFHLAALLHINNPPPSMYETYYRTNAIGTRNIVDASLVAGVKRVIFFSTISVYGASLNNQIFDESSPVNPLTIYAKTKLLAEKYCTPNVTILRLASVYGQKVTGNYKMLIEAVKRGFFVIPSSPSISILPSILPSISPSISPSFSSGFIEDKKYNKQNKWIMSNFLVNSDITDILAQSDTSDRSACRCYGAIRTLIHENDVVSAAIIAATHQEAAGKIYNLTDGSLHSLEDIVRAIATAFSVNVRIVRVNGKPIKLFSEFTHRHNDTVVSMCKYKDSNIHKLLACFFQNIEKPFFKIDKLMENVAVNGQKIQTELGFKPQYNLQNGWNHALRRVK